MDDMHWDKEALDSYDHIVASDLVRAEALDLWLDKINDDPNSEDVTHIKHQDGFLVDVRVHGRSDYSLIVWRFHEDGRPWILHVGKNSP